MQDHGGRRDRSVCRQMRVLVTGGAGFIGSHLVEILLENDNDVVVLDNMSTGKVENLSICIDNKRLQLVRGDVREYRAVDKCMDSIDVIVHLAAIANIQDSLNYPSEAADVNVNGTLNVLKAAAKHHADKFIFASSSAVYGEPKRLPTEEDDPVDALSPYAATKIESEANCRRYRELFGLDSLCLRFFNVYGSGRQARYHGGVIPQFIERIKAGLSLEVFGDGNQTRDFVNVKDAVEAIMIAIRNGIDEDTLNVGSGRAVTVNQLGRTLLSISGKTPENLIHKPARRGEIRHSLASLARVSRCLGFVPHVELEDGLRYLLNGANGGHVPSEDFS